jgi:hypothetical protein
MRDLTTKLAVVLLALAGSGVGATPITYRDTMWPLAVSVGNTPYSCNSTTDPNCAQVTMIATADTSTIQAFNVPGATGFKNTVLTSVSVDISLFDGATSWSFELVPGQVYVSVDQTNGGAGFGSAGSPTYPLSTYGSRNGADYLNFDLASNFYTIGFGGFCTDISLCDSGAPLHTTSGEDIVISYPYRPNSSIFEASVPDPGTAPDYPVLPDCGLACIGQPFRFTNPVSGHWFDPPAADGFVYSLSSGQFTGLILPPASFGFGPVQLSVGSNPPVQLTSDGSFYFFSDPGITSFELNGIDPALDTGAPDFASAYPVYLLFDGSPDLLTITPMLQPESVPEPGVLALLMAALVGLQIALRRRP